MGGGHRVGRVLSVSPRLKGWVSPNSNEGTYTVVLYIYKYFVGGGTHLPGVEGILITTTGEKAYNSV